MAKTSPLAETIALTPEATDESLILAARELNASYNGHLKRSIEDFWRLGETLSQLYQRRNLKGRWADILAEIGINVTTDNHARRLFRATTIDGLSEFRNKTAALRSFGILPTPASSSQVRDVSRPEGSHGWREESIESIAKVQVTAEPRFEEDGERMPKAGRPDRSISPSGERRTFGTAPVLAETDDTRSIPTWSDVAGTSDPLEVLAKIAARLECLSADTIEVTPDHIAQIDRMLVAIDLIRSKGVVDAA